MKSYIVIILFLLVNQLRAQASLPVLNTNWYLTQIEENNQLILFLFL